MAEQKIFPQQIDTTGSTTGQVLFSNGTNAYWGSGGFTGSNGYTGSVGIGYTGSNGYFGSVGYSGSIGNPGYTGSQGFWGSNGYFGSVGYSGSKGDSGYTGSKGTDGVIGYWGSVGYTGSIGAGYTGSTGTTAILYTSTTAPSSPVAGTFWYKTDEATLYVYYNDGDSNQWVGVTAAGSTGYTGSSGGGGGGNGYTGSIGYSGSSGSASLTAVRQQFTGDGSTTTFAVAGGYTPNAISVFVNGVLLRNGTEVTVTNGSTIVFAIAPLSGALIDVIGTVPTTYSSITPQGYSVQFNGTTQSLTLGSTTDFKFLHDDTQDYTVEFWANPNSLSSGGDILSTASVSSQAGIRIGFSTFATADISWVVYNGSTGTYASRTTGTGIAAANVWQHVAITFTATTKTVAIYLNGVAKTTSVSGSDPATRSYSTSNSANALRIGAISDASSNFYNGYISNLRITKKIVYTGNFTVPSSPITATQPAVYGTNIQEITTQTSLLTCNAPTIIDGSTNAFTITNNGSAPVSTAIVPTFTNVTINNPSVPYYSVTSLVVGGGGGGGGYAGGGGGAGGFVAATSTLIVGSTYTVVVGGGGSAGVGNASTGVSGGLSLFNTSTALGGGGGGAKTVYALSGGSGGGGGPASSTPTGPGSGTNGQGFAGGVGFDGTTQFSTGGGGGGASAVGGNSGTSSASNTSGGAGGAGLASSITGSSVTYAGGGGGGTDAGSATMPGSGGAGGSGGGGTGGKYTVSAATAGTTNLGGGGGGAGWTTAGWNTGGAGGSGVVIISVPVANYTGTTTGSPTVTTNGNFKILTFTASGTYTA